VGTEKDLLELLGVDDYDLVARFTPAVIFELGFLLSFHDLLPLDYETLKKLAEIFPLGVYTPVVLVILALPLKAFLRTGGEILQRFMWLKGHPTTEHLKKNKDKLSLLPNNIPGCEGKGQNLADLLEKRECLKLLERKMIETTRGDNRLKTKQREYELFRNLAVAFIVLTLLAVFFNGKYPMLYLALAALSFAAAYYNSQLLNSYLGLLQKKQ